MKNLINLYHQAEDYFFKSISSKYLHLGDNTNAYMTGIPVDFFNLVNVSNSNINIDEILNKSKQFFDQNNLPFTVIIPQEYCTPEIDDNLNTMGYHQTEKSVAMAHNLVDSVQSNATNFPDDSAILSNNHKLDEWILPLIKAFQSTSEISTQYVNTHTLALKKKVDLHHFSLYKQEQPIASITLSLHNNIARIDDVGTLPEFQRKGYATRLITYALSKAKKLGAKHCFLSASESGFSVYQKLGFKTLFTYNIYSKKP